MRTIIIFVMLASVIMASALNVTEAIDQNDLSGLKALLQINPELINEKSELGLTPLNQSSITGNLEIFKYLVESGADLTIGDLEGSVAIHNAAANNRFEIVKYLLDNDLMDVNVVDNFGMSALQFAMRADNPEQIEYLLKKGADALHKSDNGRGLLLSAAIWGNIDVLNMLLDAGVDPNQRNERDLVPLHSAAGRGHLEVVKILVDKGADFNLVSERGNSPIVWAIARDQVEVLKYFIAQGYDINTTTDDGRSLLHTAANGYPKVMAFLIESGLDIEAKDENGNTPLLIASWGRSPEAIKQLVAAGADVNVISNGGDTPLLRASRSDSLNSVVALLEGGANPNPLDINNGSDACAAITGNPLHLAVQMGKLDVAKLLLKNGAEVNCIDKTFGRQPLHFAAIKGQKDMVELLLANGAKINSKDEEKRRPLYYAQKYNNKTVVDFLKENRGKSSKLKGSDCCDFLTKDINNNESVIWYMNHSGWAVRNGDKLLIFDYWEPEAEADHFSLNNGHLNAEELQDLDVYIFASHTHADHYDEKIWGMADLPNVHYIMGFEPTGDHTYSYIPDHETEKVGDIKVTTIASNDTGQGFLVTVNNQTIFHPGDHANRTRDFSGNYLEEINFLKDVNGIIDIAFMPVSGCNFGDSEAVRLGVHKTCEILTPRLFIPMHASGNEQRYHEFVVQAKEDGLKTDTAWVTNSGDRIIYKIGEGAR